MIVAYACDCMCYVWKFWDEIILRGGECKTREKSNFSEKWQNNNLLLCYMLKTWKFSRS